MNVCREQTSRGHKAALSLVPLLSDSDWHVSLAAARGILRLETNRLMAEIHTKKSRGVIVEISGSLPYKHTITQSLLAMIERTAEGADLLHLAVLEVLDQICAKDDVDLLKHLVKRLIHEDPKVRDTSLKAVQVVVNGQGLRLPAGVSAPDLNSASSDGKKLRAPMGKYDAVVEACASFIAELTAQQRECGTLQNQALDVEIALQKSGADKVALKAELERLQEKIASLKLPEEEAVILAGRLQTVMDCMCSVVPQGNEAAINCVVMND